jgi:hypothetical protein
MIRDIPHHIIDSLLAYQRHHRELPPILIALVANDLQAYCLIAEYQTPQNLFHHLLPDLVAFVALEFSPNILGSIEKYNNHIDQRPLQLFEPPRIFNSQQELRNFAQNYNNYVREQINPRTRYYFANYETPNRQFNQNNRQYNHNDDELYYWQAQFQQRIMQQQSLEFIHFDLLNEKTSNVIVERNDWKHEGF